MEEIYEDAFNIARRVQTLAGGLRTFRRHWPDLTNQESRDIFNRVLPRAQRVAYFEDANASSRFSRARMGCPAGGSVIFATYEVGFIDEDGNQHQQHFHVLADIEPRVGDIRNELENKVLLQLQDRYFENHQTTDLWRAITNARIVQAKCLTGGTR